MLTLDLDEFTFELKEGAIKHVGPSNREATAMKRAAQRSHIGNYRFEIQN
jgi:hypothetical protein